MIVNGLGTSDIDYLNQQQRRKLMAEGPVTGGI